MGSCFSKKKAAATSSSLNASASHPVPLAAKEPGDLDISLSDTLKGESESKISKNVNVEEEVKKHVEEASLVKKEIFVIKHRKSQDRDKRSPALNINEAAADGLASTSTSTTEMVMRASSCTKEEVDAILIQCGRLSRSNSSGAGKPLSSGRKYSGSKRSYDFDHNDQDQHLELATDCNNNGGYDDETAAERRQHRPRHRHSSPSSSSQGRRRTPSRERDQNQQQYRSGSRERGSGSGRRVSRSPGRRSETSSTTSAPNCSSNKPTKMVSVPATVSSLAMDKSNNGVHEPQTTAPVKRISVRRNAGETAATRSAASPRSRSPARTNVKVCNENSQQQQQPSLSRSSSRKAEHSPYRRNPLSDIDTNSLAHLQVVGNKNVGNTTNSNSSKVQVRSKEMEGQEVVKETVEVANQVPVQKPISEIDSRGSHGTICQGRSMDNRITKEQQLEVEGTKGQPPASMAAAALGAGSLKPETLTRSRSARRSRDLDLNPETLLNPVTSYNSLLLEDIHNFHQKNTNTTSISLPPCLSKACSILEAVADLNSTTSSNLSCAISTEDRKTPPAASAIGKKKLSDSFVESEVFADDSLMQPSFHKYVTVRRGGTSCEDDMDEQESSGSNSIVVGGSHQHWAHSSSSLEPNSADSTDRWTSRSNTRDREGDEKSPLSFQRHNNAHDTEEGRRGFSGQRTGIGRGRG